MSMMTQERTKAGLTNPLAGVLEKLGTKIAQYRVYARTRDELQMLSDRELADLGIGRSEIPGIARTTAYGE